MKILTYTRVSTDDQNVAAQELEVTEHCRRNGWTILQAFSDVLSGAKASRPGLDAMVARCRQGGVEAIVIAKLDRLGRSLLNVVTLIEELGEIGVATICTSQGIDTRHSNPCGRVTYQILAAVSEFERNLIRERTKAGLAVARANGKPLGRVSPVMPADRSTVITQWITDGKPGGFRNLGQRLGGVGPGTAWRIFKGAEKCEVVEW